MMPVRDIFLSYRRNDSPGEARALYRDLTSKFGSGRVFIDVGGITAGLDFRKVLDQKLSSCGVLLAVIGKNWLRTELRDGNATEANIDYIQLEISTALKRAIPVIPVLVQDAPHPQPQQLPADMQELAYRQHIRITHEGWDADVQRLLLDVTEYVSADRQPASKLRRKALTLTALFAIGALGTTTAIYRHFKAANDATTANTSASHGAAAGDMNARAQPGDTHVSAWESQKNTEEAQEKNLRASVSRILAGQDTKRSVTVKGEVFEIGRKIPVPDSTWVTVLNEKSVSNSNVVFSFNDSCVLEKGGVVEIRGFLADGRGLFEYRAPTPHQAGSPCPSGIIFASPL